MNDQVDNENVVDGFSDTKGETNVDAPDPGNTNAQKPLSPEEYAKLQKEAREEEDK
jgi:hypothetical protein